MKFDIYEWGGAALPSPLPPGETLWLHVSGYWHPEIVAILVLRAAGYTREVDHDHP